MKEPQLNVVIPKNLKKALEKFCVENDLKIKQVVEIALIKYLGNTKN